MRLVQTTTERATGKKVTHTVFQTDEIELLEKFQSSFITSAENSNDWEILTDTIGIQNKDYKITYLIVE